MSSATFSNNYSSDFDGNKLAQQRLAMSEEIPKGFKSQDQFSKSLTFLLRHGAPRVKIRVHPGGYIDTEAVLNHFSGRCTEEDIERVVVQDKKNRFHIRKDPATGISQVRANQGHTFPVDDDGSLLTEVSREPGFSEITHGTTQSAWLSIKKQGLSRMRRNHIHFIRGRAGADHEMLPGYRNTSTVLVIVDIRKAMLQGIKFFRSQNDVILSPGDDKGFISTEFFKRVIDTKTNEDLWPRSDDPTIDRRIDSTSLQKLGTESTVLEATHNTTMSMWKRFKKSGLIRTGEDYIFFREGGVRSCPQSSEAKAVLVSIDVRKAMMANIDFYRLPDRSIVSKGNANGSIPTKYFKQAIDTRSGETLWPPSKK